MASDLKALIEQNLFHPDKEHKNYDEKIFERIRKNGMDILVLIDPEATKGVLFFPNNTGNHTFHTEKMKLLQQHHKGCDIWCFDYPGFGLNTSESSTINLIQMAQYVYSYMSKQYDSIEWVGESIGNAVMGGLLVAPDVKLPKQPVRITYINPFKSISSMASERNHNIGSLIKKLGYEMNLEKYSKLLMEKQTRPIIRILYSENNNEIPKHHALELSKILNINVINIKGDNTVYEYFY
jgi:hypothetical protein